MDIRVYRRGDHALIVVPALFQIPVALEREASLRLLGEATIDLELLTDDLVRDIGLYGYAVARGADEALVRTRVRRAPGLAVAVETDGA